MTRTTLTRLLAQVVILLSSPAAFADPPTSWSAAKNVADDIVYIDKSHTFYCGCPYVSKYNSRGSGVVPEETCTYAAPSSYLSRKTVLEWEHIVPASLMPARRFPCWVTSGRSECEDNDPVAQAMIFDLHNLVPSVGQINALRDNDRYTELDDSSSDFGSCAIEDTNGLFEPPDCRKGDVARAWLYMHWRHGVVISDAEFDMFLDWNRMDPVSSWEQTRSQRVSGIQGNGNPFVDQAVASVDALLCAMELGQ